jgi:hypothetical protein
VPGADFFYRKSAVARAILEKIERTQPEAVRQLHIRVAGVFGLRGSEARS